MSLRSSTPDIVDEYSNGSITKETDLIEYPAIRRTLATLHIGAIVMSALGNGLLLAYVISHRRRGHSNVTATNLILNLAACDFISSAITQPMRLFDMLSPTQGFEDSIEFCRVSGFAALFLACLGFHTIVAISLERLLLICYPLTARTWLTKRTSWTVLLSIWIVAFCSALPFPILFSYRVNIRLPTQTYRFCTIDVFRATFHYGRYYYIFIFVVYYAIPVVMVTGCYARVFYTLSSTVAYGSSVKDEAVMKMLKQRRSLAWMMVAVAVSFAAFEGPFFFTFLCFSLGFHFSRNHVFIKMLIDFLPILSCAVNPAVYLVRAKTFKRGIVGGSEARTPAGGTINLKLRTGNDPHQAYPGIQMISQCRRNANPSEILLSQCSRVFNAATLADRN